MKSIPLLEISRVNAMHLRRFILFENFGFLNHPPDIGGRDIEGFGRPADRCGAVGQTIGRYGS